MKDLDDLELVTLLRNDNKEAFTEIYNRYKWLLHTHACKKLGDRSKANDVIQEIFTNLWLKRANLNSVNNLAGYLYKATRNHILNIIAHEALESKYIGSIAAFSDNYTQPTDAIVRERQLRAAIEKEIAALPPRMREVFELSRKSYLSHKEIGDRLTISEETVNKQIKNALKILRLKLKVLFLFFL